MMFAARKYCRQKVTNAFKNIQLFYESVTSVSESPINEDSQTVQLISALFILMPYSRANFDARRTNGANLKKSKSINFN